MSKVVRLSDVKRRPRHVYFSRAELNQLLSIYSQRVIRGEWKDYAIGHSKGMAVFSIFRDSSDRPTFTVLKYSSGTHRKGDFMIYSGLRKLKRGETLAQVLEVFDRDLRLVSK